MTPPYLIADETVRTMVKALEQVPRDHLGSNRVRHEAYRAAGLALGNLALDQEAMRRQQIRRRQLGVTVFALTVIVSIRQAAAGDMEAISGNLMAQATHMAVIVALVFLALSGLLTAFYVLRMVAAYLRIRDEQHGRIRRVQADEIWL